MTRLGNLRVISEESHLSDERMLTLFASILLEIEGKSAAGSVDPN
jgi:hypothetical protein